MNYRKDEVQVLLEDKLTKYFACAPKSANIEQMYKALALVTRDILLRKKQAFNKQVIDTKGKRVYYLCMEFLLGRNLRNSLFNLGLEESARAALSGYGFNLDELYEIEKDPGLGNGGLGRLAACFMDSLATCDYPAMGFSIRYDYGLFKQRIVENQQVELPDVWLDTGEVWMMPRSDKTFRIRLGGRIEQHFDGENFTFQHVDADVVEAVPFDLMIPGYKSDAVSVLRLWRASMASDFDMKSFTQGDYMQAMRSKTSAEIISKVLYPSDEHDSGKQLRLSQQYFLVSASLQSILKDHMRNFGSLDTLAQFAAIHINDTHPALAVPELMRLLMDEHGYGWDFAWDTVQQCMAYTNHTVLAEALETWGEPLVGTLLPRIHMIIKEIDRRFCESLNDWQKAERLRVLHHGRVRMANLSVIGSHSVNGVSALHSDIIKETIFNDFYVETPQKFTNVTNGIAYRRWLCQSNPRLTTFLHELLGGNFLKDASALEKLLKHQTDKSVLSALGEIKLQNKKDFSDFYANLSGVRINPESRFDVQVKRLHEYKRQLLNILNIIHRYLDITAHPNKSVTPETFIFGAKAAGGYFHAKRIIQLINCISAEIRKRPSVRQKLDVIFVENYNVSKAERIFPASEVSQQISLAGKEASGTGNMKFMLNGAVTLGTVDGANVEIAEAVGQDNIFTFGLKADEVDHLWRHGYYATNYFTENKEIRRVTEALKHGFNGESFEDIAHYLILGERSVADPYMCLADFADYIAAADRLDAAYQDPLVWNRKALVNIAKSGIFSSDRSIRDYAKGIWGVKPVSI
ncbi:MAG: glycogen/starch/alpha-glucan phosphorylase [Firmicutes bacterium]|nr:glycogen/starch/alpha-glucan phosphorylase [Bacillota bacterium]